jgi:DNA-binding XRE family transcriptional regulator
LISENIVANEEILRELDDISPSRIATGLLKLERMLKNLKNNNVDSMEFDSLKLTDEERRKQFGARIKSARKSLGLTQADLAKKIGVTKQAITTYETGIREPSFRNLIKLSRVLNVTTDWLLGEDQQ